MANDNSQNLSIDFGIIGQGKVEDAKLALNKLTDAEGEGAEAAKKLELNHQALDQALHLLGTVTGPKAAAALEDIGKSGGGGLNLALLGVQELVGWYQRLAEEVKKTNDEMARLDLSRWEAERTAIGQATEQMAAFRREIQGSGKDIDDVSEKYKLLADKTKQAQGFMSGAVPEGLKDQFDLAKKQTEYNNLQNEIGAKGGEEFVWKIKMNADESALNAAIRDKKAADDQAALGAAKANQEKMLQNLFEQAGVKYSQEDLAKGGENMGDAVAKARQAIDQKRAEVSGMADSYQSGPDTIPNLGKFIIQGQIESAEAALADFQKNQGNIDRLNSLVAAHTQAVADLTETAKKSKQAHADSEEAVTRLTQKLKEMGAMLDLIKGEFSIKGAVTQGANELKGDEALADRARRGQSLSPTEQQRLTNDASAIAGYTVDLGTAVQIVSNGANNIGMFMNQLARLTAAMTHLDPQQITALREQIDLLAGRVGPNGQ